MEPRELSMRRKLIWPSVTPTYSTVQYTVQYSTVQYSTVQAQRQPHQVLQVQQGWSYHTLCQAQHWNTHNAQWVIIDGKNRSGIDWNPYLLWATCDHYR